jgi:hypothetical protein
MFDLKDGVKIFFKKVVNILLSPYYDSYLRPADFRYHPFPG